MNLPFNAADAEEKGLTPECTQEIVYRMLCEPGATLESTAARCKSEFSDFGCTQSPHGLANALSLWRFEYEMKRMFRSLDTRAKAYEAQRKAENPDLTPEQIAADGQRFFTAVASAAGDAKTFQDLEYLRLAKETAKVKGELETAKLELKKKQVSLKGTEVQLAIDKFQWDGAKEALAKLKELKSIAADRSLNDDQKIEQVRLRLWGAPPKEMEGKA